MPPASKDPLAELRREMERIRLQLYAALDAAGGDHRDLRVQAVSRDFDKALSAYLRAQRRRIGGASSANLPAQE